MIRRRSALLAATALATTLLAAPSAATAQEDLLCRGQAVGVLPNGKLLARVVENGEQTSAKTSERPLPFRPTNLAWAGSDPVKGGSRAYFIATAADSRPRFVSVTDKKRRSTLAVRVEQYAFTGFEPRLMAMGNQGPEILALEGSRLTRYKVVTTDRGVVFRGPQTVKRGMGGLKTLSWYSRQKISGVRQDVFYATTKAGALQQIRVPVRRPGNTKVVTVKRSGFGSFTGLSLSYCNADSATAMIVGVDAKANKAKWFSLRRQATPAARNLTEHGLAAKGKSWRIRPVV